MMHGETSSTPSLGSLSVSGTVVSLRRGVCAVVLGCGLLVAGQLASFAAPAFAQQRGPVDRTVEGKVLEKTETPLRGAVVYLKDDHTLAVKSFIVDADGHYRFGQLAQATDYELWAELDGRKSNTRAISSFDNKNSFVINLKIDTAK
jgi:hypothetical protein